MQHLTLRNRAFAAAGVGEWFWGNIMQKTPLLAAAVAVTVTWAGSGRAAEIKIFSDGPLQTALVRIVPEFRAQTGHGVEVVYGTAPTLKAKLAAGEKADVLVSL